MIFILSGETGFKIWDLGFRVKMGLRLREKQKRFTADKN